MKQSSLFGSIFGRAKAPRRRGRALMVVGTASHAGKSWCATAICRLLRRRGLKVAPFKAQNMSLNSFVCPDGAEIGRAQAAQAEACGVEPRAEMNPILLKPTADDHTQIVLNGKVWKNASARGYYDHYPELLGEVERAFERLAAEFEFIVLEGAGGAAEINLRSRDLVNLPLAARLGVPALLVGDIERGGVFASLLGTLALLEPEENRLVAGFLVNKFRGDRSLFDDGRRMLEERAGRPCFGVFPHAPDIRLDDEDVLSLDERRPRRLRPEDLRVAVVRLPHLSNTTDFRLLPQAEFITEATPYIPDVIIIPGTKNTLGDLDWMRRAGLDKWVLDQRKEGAAIWGVCGGYQILGRVVADPFGVESDRKSLPGLGLLPIQTSLTERKTTERTRARLSLDGTEFEAYEIHMGETTPAAGESPFCAIDGRPEGFLRRGLLGTYLHGAFEDPNVLAALLADAAEWRGKAAPRLAEQRSKDEDYDRLADWFEAHVDWNRFEEAYLP